jgi:hypothetical protein
LFWCSLLVNKKKRATEELLKTLHKKGLIKVDKHTHRNIYLLSHKGNTFAGREHKKSIKINCYELPHQDMLIKWLVVQNDIEQYQTEREQKMANGNLNVYPDLIITKTEDSEIYVECERTRKSPERFRSKLINLREWLVAGGKIHWVTLTPSLASWLATQINIIGAFPTQHTYEIWYNKE